MTDQLLLDEQFVTAYRAAHDKAIWVDLNNMGRLVASDRDRLDLPNRISTNKLVGLAEGNLMQSVFTTSIGRTIDSVAFLNRGDDILMITGENRGEQILNWLRRNVFFNDQYQLNDASDDLSIIGVFGKQAQSLLSEHAPSVVELELKQHQTVNIDGHDVLMAHVNELAGAGHWIIGSDEALQHLTTNWDIPQANVDVYHALRIEYGLPITAHEINEDYIPLEIGLWDQVSFNKGCYTGQEIIARMESRGKLAKMLMKVTLNQPMPEGSTVVNDDGKNMGTLTSVASIPSEDGVRHVGLAVLKSAVAIADTQLVVNSEGVESATLTVNEPAGDYQANYS